MKSNATGFGTFASGTATILLAVLSGCSWLAVTPVPSDYERYDELYCTQERYVPALDVAAAAQGVVASGAWFVMAAMAANEDNGKHIAAGALASLLAAGLYGASAAYGYAATSDCVDKKYAMQLEREGERPRPLVGEPKRQSTPPRARVAVDAPTTNRVTLEPQALRSLAEKYTRRFEECLTRAYEQGDLGPGTYRPTVNWTVQALGQVGEVDVVAPQELVSSTQARECVKNIVTSWTFRAPLRNFEITNFVLPEVVLQPISQR